MKKKKIKNSFSNLVYLLQISSNTIWYIDNMLEDIQ